MTTAPTHDDRPQPDGSDIRRMTAEDIPPVATALADAFYDDPVLSWVTPDDGARRARLDAAFTFYLERVWLKHDHCFTHVEHAGAALWEPPDTWKLGVLEQLRLLPRMIAVTRGDFVRMMRFLTLLEKQHPTSPSHYYLPVIGVAGPWQGRGFGAALLRPVLDRCDTEGAPAYLEATTPRNRALYERHGFTVRDELRVGDSPPFWPMWREPQTRATV